MSVLAASDIARSIEREIAERPYQKSYKQYIWSTIIEEIHNSISVYYSLIGQWEGLSSPSSFWYDFYRSKRDIELSNECFVNIGRVFERFSSNFETEETVISLRHLNKLPPMTVSNTMDKLRYSLPGGKLLRRASPLEGLEDEIYFRTVTLASLTSFKCSPDEFFHPPAAARQVGLYSGVLEVLKKLNAIALTQDETSYEVTIFFENDSIAMEARLKL